MTPHSAAGFMLALTGALIFAACTWMAPASAAPAADKDALIRTYDRGVDYGTAGRFEEALAAFDELSGRGSLEVPVERLREAVADVIDGKLDRETALCLFKGIDAFDDGDYDPALENLDRAIELDPELALAYFYRGGIYIYTERRGNTSAVSDFDHAIELDPGFAMAWYLRGVTHVKKGEFDKALKDFTRAIELRPDYRAAYSNRGVLHIFINQDVSHGCEDFRRLCELGRCAKYETLKARGHCG